MKFSSDKEAISIKRVAGHDKRVCIEHPPVQQKHARKPVRSNVGRSDARSDELHPSSNLISFRYSYRSMTSDGHTTHIHAKEQRFENGQFETEEFEGTMEGDAYNDSVNEMQRRFQKRLASFFNPFSAFLPFDDDNERGR